MSDPTGTDRDHTPRASRWAGPVVPALVVAALAIAALVLVVLTDEGDDTTPTTTTTVEPATTTGPGIVTSSTTTTTTTTPTTTAPSAADQAVWPPPGSTDFDDPVDLVRSFAEEYVGFTDPTVGEFLQGDARSGEVEVRPAADGPVTTVLVRLLGAGDAWSVIGTATADVEVASPMPLATVGDSVRLAGRARAFEGHVDVEVRADGVDEPIARGFVTGSGDGELGPFDEQLDVPPSPAPAGSVVFVIRSAEDGRVWEAAVVRVRFQRR